MKVSTCKCLISVFFAMTVCQGAVAVEQFDLLPCTEGGSGGMLYCIEYDSVGDVSYLHDNITRRITVKLPVLVLTQLWLNQGEIVIVTPSGEVINNGQELIRSEDRDRWTITFNFQRVNSDYGNLHLVLHIKDVEYRDEQLLHMEIRTADNIFMTRKKIWFPVQVKQDNGDSDHEGEVTTIENPSAEDPSAILRACIETLQYQTEVLRQKLMTTMNELEETVKYETEGNNKLDITTLVLQVLLLLGTGLIIAHMVLMLKSSKLVHVSSNGFTVVDGSNKSFFLHIDRIDEAQADTLL